jgi:putative transposase
VFAGRYVDIREVADEIWLAGRPSPRFMEYDPGYCDEEEARVEPGPNPFVPEV